MQIVFESGQIKDPKISVIIMFKNEGVTIPLALDSLIRQKTDFEWEVIFLDGCSTDDSIDVIKKHKLSSTVPVRIVSLPPDNCGMVVAQNTGAKLARAPYGVLMQADVRIEDDKALSKVLKAFDDSDTVATYYVGLGPGEDMFKYDFWGQVFSAQYHGIRNIRSFDTKFNGIRRDVFLKIGGMDEKKMPFGGGDFLLEQSLLCEGKIAETDIEAEHLHGFGKRHSARGLMKKYCRNAEVTGVCAPQYLIRGTNIAASLQHWVVVLACLISFYPPFWPWSPLSVFLFGLYWSRAVYLYVRSWRVVQVPFFSFAVMYAFAFFFLKGLLGGKTRYVFDNKMN